MSTISAGTSSGTALVSTGDTSGNLVLQVNGTTTSVTLNTSGAIGVGSSPSYGSSGQVLTSGGSSAAPSWAAAASGFSQAQVFTSSGTFTVPSSGKFKVTIIGGGGSGGCGSSPLATQAGGSAGTVIKWYTGATAGATATVTIGAGGSGVLASNTAGNSGGNSTFALSGFTTLTAGGGGGGAGGFPAKNNGTASGGDININGQNGMGPAYASDGSGNTRVATLGGSTPLGLGSSWGMTVSTEASTNYPASGYGAGGGSGNNSVWFTTSGAGTGGICIVEY